MPVSPYTRERLEEAASSSRTLSEALGKLGVDPKSSTRRYVHQRMKKLGVDVSHFEREGVRWTSEILEAAVSASTNMCEVLRRLGLEIVGGHHTHISRRIKAYGIDTSHFQVPSRRGETRRPRTPESLLVEQTTTHARRIPSDRLKWALTALGVPERCARCGMEPVWRGHPLPLEVDHIDGNWRDNRVENLRYLCPNCHSTTDSYRGRAKGRAQGGAS
ncbi:MULTISPECIES: HNH endonuclease signature motif containing protein [unclassified Streptomyces]|uniref:HNH endonuclease signature motif containing protein n=1 Tax=unclassified Streptomyces TaxID=2593676 RepID=UPI002DDB4134|nr:HNH endonuclease signature motif containing protein [Streptomyces sp. NBC_00243]WRZ22213.1 HNH endonuclease [Streptomyces sp. NBC_00243]